MATVATQTSLPAPGPLRVWLLAARPRTLGLALAPVLVGTALAHAHGGARAGPALAALAGALLIQIGTNFANDVFDFEKGADAEDRVGPPRAAQLGWLSPRELRAGMGVAFAAAAVVGLYLISVGGWPIALLGLASIAAGLAYTGGPWPLGYHGLGDLAVFLFFGTAAVCGTAYLQTGQVPSAAWVASLPVGALATAVLVVNNLRDREGDARAGKRTLAVRFGAGATRVEYSALLASSYAVPVLQWWLGAGGIALLLPWLTLPLAVSLARKVWTSESPEVLDATLSDTGRLTLVFSMLFAIAWAVGARGGA